MFPLIGGLISGGASLLGSMFSSDTSAQNTQAQIQAQEQMQQQTENFNANQAQINRDYQTSMSNTAYQRATADMTKAGLNPMMMFGSGGPASVPSGATASVGTPSVPVSQAKGAWSGIGDAVNKGLDAMISAKTLDKMTEEVANLQAQQAKTAADTEVSKATVPLVTARTATEQSEAVKREAESRSAQLDVPGHAVGAATANAIGDMPKWLFNTLVQGSFVGKKADDVISPLVNSAGAVRRFLPSRSTSETTRSGDQTFTDRWDNLMGTYQR